MNTYNYSGEQMYWRIILDRNSRSIWLHPDSAKRLQSRSSISNNLLFLSARNSSPNLFLQGKFSKCIRVQCLMMIF